MGPCKGPCRQLELESKISKASRLLSWWETQEVLVGLQLFPGGTVRTAGQVNLLVPAVCPETTFRKKPTCGPSLTALVGTFGQSPGDRFPLCLDDLTDPVTIKCGHNFCQSLMGRSARQVLLSCLLTPMPRGEPQKQCPAWGGMIGITQELHIRKSKDKNKRQETRTCGEKHRWVLTLFFGDSLQLLCNQCIRHL